MINIIITLVQSFLPSLAINLKNMISWKTKDTFSFELNINVNNFLTAKRKVIFMDHNINSINNIYGRCRLIWTLTLLSSDWGNEAERIHSHLQKPKDNVPVGFDPGPQLQEHEGHHLLKFPEVQWERFLGQDQDHHSAGEWPKHRPPWTDQVHLWTNLWHGLETWFLHCWKQTRIPWEH